MELKMTKLNSYGLGNFMVFLYRIVAIRKNDEIYFYDTIFIKNEFKIINFSL